MSFCQDDISAGECLKSLDIMEREQQCCCLLEPWTPVSLSLCFSLSPVTFQISLMCFSVCFVFVPNRHTYAQFVLWWLQARAVCEAFIWSCDQIGVLLCQHRVRLWRTLPTLPTTKLWYGYSNHSTLYAYGDTSC